MIDEETLAAYVDGELAAADRVRVEQAAAASPRVAERLRAHEALRAAMAAAFAGALAEPAPERLRAQVTTAAPAPAKTEVIDFAAQAARRRPPSRAWAIGAGMAACLAVGLLAGPAFKTLGPVPPIGTDEGGLVAQGALADALETQLASTQGSAPPIRIGLTLRTADGRYCRTFRMRALAGLACRGPSRWSIRMTAASEPPPPSGGYRTAGSDTPALILERAEALSAGPALDAQAEAAARAAHWR